MASRLSVIIEQDRHDRRKKSYEMSLYILEVLLKYGFLPPYSETQAKKAKPPGYEWDTE